MSRGRDNTRRALLAVLLLVVVWGVYWLLNRLAELGPSLAANQYLLPALSLAMVVLALALAGVLIRNLVRLIVDRKRGLLGARLRTKLVFFFLVLVLLPASLLFSGSAQVIKQTVEAILRTPLEDLTRQSGEIVEQWRDYFEDQSLRKANGLAEDIESGGLLASDRREALEELVERWQREHELDLVQVSIGDDVLTEAGTSRPLPAGAEADELAALVTDLTRNVAEAGRASGRINHLGQGLLAHAATPVGDPAAASVVSVGMVLPTRLAGNLEGFSAAEEAYRQFRAQRRDLVRLYLTLIGIIFLVTVIIAVWMGFYVSRRITVPIQEMAGAAREISAGNLDVRVKSTTGDEVGELVEAFNEMAVQLEESRAVITRSTADLRRSNRALDERRRYIETLVANLSTAVISLDPEGRVTTANPATRQILSVELHPGEEAQPALRLRGLEALAELLDQRQGTAGVRRDLTLQHRGGPQHVSVQMSPLVGGSEENVGTLLMVEDLTDLMRAQRAAAWREVARRIAHEIKNPLTPIQLAAQRLRKKFDSGSPDLGRVVHDSTESIEQEVAGLKQLVDEFSRFARMPELAPRLVEFRSVVDSVLELYRGLPGVEWELDLDEGIGQVLLDPQQMRRVLMNLIDNAVAALGGNGTIFIRARQEGENTLRIEVADSGPGIPAADRDKMFVPYFSTKRRGTGLGLAIVHKVVTDHRGTIRVEDNDPHGARFVIEIPA